MYSRQKYTGFTIVELLIVIVVIAILAAISIVAYNGIQSRAQSSAAQSSVQQASKKIEALKLLDGSYPASLAAAGIQNGDVTYGYNVIDSGDKACVWAQSGSKVFTMQTGSVLVEGQCGQVLAAYYDARPASNAPVFTRAEDDFSDNWGSGSPDPRIPVDNFTVTYTAWLVPPVTGAYTFTVTTDDFSQVFIDGVEVLPYTNNRTSNVNVNLVANQRVKVIYTGAEAGGAAYTIFEWAYPGQARTSVPASAFRRP